MPFMKTILISLLIISALTATVESLAASLSANEAASLVEDVERVFNSFNEGDPEPFIRSSHPLVYQHAGGQEAFESQAREAIQAFRDADIELTTLKTGAPSELIVVDGGEICFVPRTIHLNVGGRQARQVTYVVAIRDVSPQWRYVDGSSFRAKPNLALTMLPFLPKDVQLPPNTMEVLE